MLLPEAGLASRRLSGRQVLYYHDPMHPSYRSDRPGIAPDCNMELTPVYADEAASGPALVRVDDAAGRRHRACARRRRARKQGPAKSEPWAASRRRSRGRYQVTAGADGWIRTVHGGESGSLVAKGQAAGVVLQPGHRLAQQAYLYALDSLERVRARDSSPEQKELAAKQVTQARDYLEFLGMTDRQIADLDSSRQESREVTLGAPAAGRGARTQCVRGRAFHQGRRALGDRRHRIRLDHRRSVSGRSGLRFRGTDCDGSFARRRRGRSGRRFLASSV